MTKTSHASADADVDALIRLGAKEISELRDDSGALIGYELKPPVSMAGYDQAVEAGLVERKRAAWSGLREDRRKRLAESDWTQLMDAPLTPEQRSEWASYRQALRDLPKATKDPFAADWPKPPG